VNTSYAIYTGDEEHWSPVLPPDRSVQLIARSRGERTGVRRMINDVPTPMADSVQRSGMELSKACVTRDQRVPSRIVSGGLKEISVIDTR